MAKKQVILWYYNKHIYLLDESSVHKWEVLKHYIKVNYTVLTTLEGNEYVEGKMA